MFVAVVYKFHEDTFPKSHRPEGGYEAFLGETEQEAVEAALTQAQRWELMPKVAQFNLATNKYDPPKYYGPYQILVGELGKEAKRFSYKIVATE